MAYIIYHNLIIHFTLIGCFQILSEAKDPMFLQCFFQIQSSFRIRPSVCHRPQAQYLQRLMMVKCTVGPAYMIQEMFTYLLIVFKTRYFAFQNFKCYFQILFSPVFGIYESFCLIFLFRSSRISKIIIGIIEKTFTKNKYKFRVGTLYFFSFHLQFRFHGIRI